MSTEYQRELIENAEDCHHDQSKTSYQNLEFVVRETLADFTRSAGSHSSETELGL